MLSPGEVCKKLHIQPSTLRKYSLLFEKEQIVFKRNKNNARLYTVTELAALQEVVTAMKNGHETLEKAVTQAADKLKGNGLLTADNDDTGTIPERHNDDIAAATMNEVRALREEIKKRDLMFVEALESLQKEIQELKQERQPAQIESQERPADPEEKKRGGFWSWIRKK